MSISLYDLSVKNYLQIISAAKNVLKKGEAFCQQNNIDPSELVSTQIHSDMLPLWFQVVSIAHHSIGAIKGIEKGEFTPPVPPANPSYADLIALLENAQSDLEAYSEDQINGLMGKKMVFKMGSLEIPFTAENFIHSFSLPNFHFHATTTYDILRMKGVKLGKQDYLGQMRIG